MSTITLRGSTQPQGEPIGVELNGSVQTVLEQPAEGTQKKTIQHKKLQQNKQAYT